MSMFSYPQAILLFSMLVFQNSYAANTPPTSIEIAVEDAASPWSNKDGTGFANEVVIAAYKAVDTNVTLSVVPYARCKHEVIEGHSPACFSMSWEPPLKDKVLFSEKPLFTCYADFYYNIKKVILAKKESEFRKGTVIGLVNGYEYPPGVTSLANKGIILETGVSEEANLQKLALGRLDLTIINHNDIKPSAAMLEQAGVSDKVAFAFRGGILKSYIGFSTKHIHGDWARQQFNKGFAKIHQNGVLAEIEKKWIKQFELKHPTHGQN